MNILSKEAAPSASMATESSHTTIASSSAGSKPNQRFSSGREDGYTEEEWNAADLPTSLPTTSGADFFGRSKELEMLHKVKQQVILSDARQDNDTDIVDGATSTLLPAVLVWGVSGTGKSHLIKQFLKETEQLASCYILQGKYDEYTGSSDPFSAIVQALNDFSSQLKNGPLEELERIRRCIKAGYANDDDDDDQSPALSALLNVVPSLSVLLYDYHGSAGSVASVASGSTNRFFAGSASVTTTTSSQRSAAVFNQGGVTTEGAWNRLKYIFLQFVRSISTKERPVYMFLDDLQWSSPVALELMANLVLDPELNHFLLLGSIRQEANPHTDDVLEVTTNSPLHASFLSRLQSQNRELAQITMQHLSMEDTVQFLSCLLDNHSVKNGLGILAEKIYATTQGNIFFTVQALEELQRNKVLVYNQMSSEWEWTLDGDDVLISNNINRVLESKLKQLPQDVQDTLSIAVYMGAIFDVETLFQVVHAEQQCHASPFFATAAKAITKDYLSTLLEKAVLEQLLSNPIGGSKYRFAHDQIQQAAHGMVSHREAQNMLRLRIGHCLLQCYRGNTGHSDDVLVGPAKDSAVLASDTPTHQGSPSSEGDHGLLFVAADHLNSVPSKDHLFAALLNLEVGERAIHMAALTSAAAYFERAVNQLKSVRDPWKEHYDISLRLYRARCDVEISLGNFQTGYNLGDTVLTKAKTLDDKLSTYLSMAHGLVREDRFLESLKLCLSAATQMREFPKRWHLGHLAADMLKIKSFLKKNDNDAILQLPLMTDKRKLMAMELLTEVAVGALLTQNISKWLLAMCKRIRSTIQFGLCEYSAMSFISFGILSATRDDQAMAMRCAGLAQRIIAKTNGRSLAGKISFAIASYIVPYRIPIADVIKEHQRGYVRSMEAGELEAGFANWQCCIFTSYLAGRELQPLIQAAETTLQYYKIYRMESMSNKTEEYLSMMQMMTGKKSIDWDELEESANRNIKSENSDPSQLLLLSFHFYCKMILALYFRRYDLGTKFAHSYRCVTAKEKAAFGIIARSINPGINAAGRYRETGKRKHLRTLCKTLAESKRIVKTKGPKFVHHVLMLKAELASIQKQSQSSPSSVKEAYDLAILVASKALFVQDAALTCELAGEHCIREGCPKAETSAYFVKAVGFYEDWGCVVKVDDLKQRRSEYLTGLNENRRAGTTKTKAQDGKVVLFGNDPSSSQGPQMDMLSSFVPSIPAMGRSVAGSGTKITLGLQEQIVDGENHDGDDNLSVLTDSSQ